MADVTVRFFQPHRTLCPYIITYYLTEVEASIGKRVIDYLQPERANLWIINGDMPLASVVYGHQL